MHLVSYLVVLALALTTGLLNTYVQDPEAGDAARTVLTTALYSVASGSIVNGACAIMARATNAVESGDEMGACSPYGIMGTGVAARLHLYWIDGYGPEEWAYVRSTPGRAAAGLKEGLDKALSVVDLDTEKLGLARSEQDVHASQS